MSMFTSFAQLASSLEASLSLDALQSTISSTTGIKTGEETLAVDDGGDKGFPRPPVNSNPKANSNRDPNVSNGYEETEIQLVEEISRVSELLRVKDAECSTLQFQLAESKRDLQSGKLALADLTNDLKSAKSLEKSAAADSDHRANTAERIIADLREEINHQKKISDDKSAKLKTLQLELAEASEREKELSVKKEDSSESFFGDSESNDNDALVQQLQHENAALKRECTQNVDTIADFTDQIRSLGGLLADAKVTSRLTEDKLITSQREVSSLKETIENIQAGSAVFRLEKENEIMTMTSSNERIGTEMTSLKDKIGLLEAEITQQKAVNNALKDMRDKQSTADTEKTSEIEDLYRSLSQASDNIEQERSLLTASQLELAVVHKTIIEKDGTIADLQGKLTTLTDKMKDIVKKYGEMKAKNSSIEHAGGEKSAEMVKQMQSKEAEMLSLRLKLENTERGAADQRAMASELAERYGEAQRELARAKAGMQEHLLTIESQQQELKERQNIITQVTNEKISMNDKLSATTIEKHGLEGLVLELKEEKALIQEQLRSGDDSARVLDEYKKRAQLALKKSNSASAALSAELSVMRASVSEAQSRVIEAEEMMNDALARCEALEMDLNHTKRTLDSMQIERDKAIDAERAASLTAEDAVARVRELSSAMQVMKASTLQNNMQNNANNNSNNASQSYNTTNNGTNINKNTGSTPNSSTKQSNLDTSNHEILIGNYDHNDRDNNRDNTSNKTNTLSSGISSSSSLKHQDNGHSSGSQSNTDLRKLSDTGTGTGVGSGVGSVAGMVGGGGGVSGVSQSAAAGRRGSIPAASSSSSLASNGDNIDNGSHEEGKGDIDGGDDRILSQVPSSDKLYYVNELYSQMDELRKEVALRGVEVESTRQDLQNEIALKKKLEGRVEELLAYLDRSKKFQGDGPDSATNTEYLKNCVYRFMATTEHSERRRLAPVISTILKLTTQEKRTIDAALAAGDSEDMDTLATIGAFTSSLGSFFGALPAATPP